MEQDSGVRPAAAASQERMVQAVVGLLLLVGAGAGQGMGAGEGSRAGRCTLWGCWGFVVGRFEENLIMMLTNLRKF